MIVPFQLISYCFRQDQDIILAASGHQILSFRVDGSFLSKWSSSEQDALSVSMAIEYDRQDPRDEIEPGPPEKRRKVDQEEVSNTSSAKKATENGKNRQTLDFKSSASPSIMILCPAPDGLHLVAVTGDDKRLRVLELHGDGRLEQRNERYCWSPFEAQSTKLIPESCLNGQVLSL